MLLEAGLSWKQKKIEEKEKKIFQTKKNISKRKRKGGVRYALCCDRQKETLPTRRRGVSFRQLEL